MFVAGESTAGGSHHFRHKVSSGIRTGTIRGNFLIFALSIFFVIRKARSTGKTRTWFAYFVSRRGLAIAISLEVLPSVRKYSQAVLGHGLLYRGGVDLLNAEEVQTYRKCTHLQAEGLCLREGCLERHRTQRIDETRRNETEKASSAPKRFSAPLKALKSKFRE